MFGSDWPVCKLAGAEHGQVFLVQCLIFIEKTNFFQVVTLLKNVLEICNVDESEFEFIFRENALSVYKL